MKYHAWDIEGNPVLDEDGEPMEFDSEEEASKFGGPVHPVPDKALDLTRSQDYFMRLRDAAEEEVPDTIKEGTKVYSSCVAHNMLAGTELDKRSIKAIQAQILVEVVKHDLHLAHPNGYKTLTAFMRGSGMTSGHFYELASFAEEIVPYLEDHGVNWQNNVKSEHVAKTMEAVPAMKRMIKAGEEDDRFTDVLDDLLKMPGKRAATAKYRRRRDGETIGDASVNHIDSNTSVITIITDDVETIVKALKGKLTYELVATVRTQGKSITINTSLP